MNELQIASLIGLLLYFALLLAVVMKEKRSKDALDFFFAGRTLPFWCLSITFIASWWGAGSALSTADLSFDEGIGGFWYYGVPVLVSTLLMMVGAAAIRRVGYLTQGEMMSARYSKRASTILSLMVFAFMTLSASSQMAGIGGFFGSYLGLDYEIAVLAGTAIVLVYSLFGGFRGVVYTDVIQFVLLAISALAVFVCAFSSAGGMEGIAEAAARTRDVGYMDFTSGLADYGAYILTFGCAWSIQANVWQRISATRSDRDARRMTTMSFFAFIPLYLIVTLTGMAGIALFERMPEGGIVSGIVIELMPPVLGAIAFVGISAAIMSTMDSLINTGAMTLTLDLLPSREDHASALRLSRIATLVVTLIALLISLKIRSILELSWIASNLIAISVFVPLLMGFFWRRGNAQGAVSGMAVGALYSLCNLLSSLGVIPVFPWGAQSVENVLIGMAITAVVHIVVSLLTRPDCEKADAFIKAARSTPSSTVE